MIPYVEAESTTECKYIVTITVSLLLTMTYAAGLIQDALIEPTNIEDIKSKYARTPRTSYEVLFQVCFSVDRVMHVVFAAMERAVESTESLRLFQSDDDDESGLLNSQIPRKNSAPFVGVSHLCAVSGIMLRDLPCIGDCTTIV